MIGRTILLASTGARGDMGIKPTYTRWELSLVNKLDAMCSYKGRPHARRRRIHSSELR